MEEKKLSLRLKQIRQDILNLANCAKRLIEESDYNTLLRTGWGAINYMEWYEYIMLAIGEVSHVNEFKKELIVVYPLDMMIKSIRNKEIQL